MSQENQIAIIIGSYITMFIDIFLKQSERNKGGTIRLRQKILSKIRKKEYKNISSVANEIWMEMVEKYKDKEVRIVVFDAVEYFAYGAEAEMRSFYGNNIIDLVDRFVLKQSFSVDKETLQDTRGIVNEIVCRTREYIKKDVSDV